MILNELYGILNNKFPTELRCEWDNDGIMCTSDLNACVERVLISLDVTSDTVEYAVENGFDTIISHHPLVFKSQKSLTPSNFTQDKLIKLVKNDISVLSFHTRLDAAQGGVNDALANLLNLQNVTQDNTDSIGRIGFLSERHSLESFASKVKSALNAPFVLFSGDKMVSKVYVVGGDGKDMIENAIENGCDTIVTGRASYNTAIDAKDIGINVVEAGHFYTEHPVCYVLEKELNSLNQGIYVEVYNSNRIKVI